METPHTRTPLRPVDRRRQRTLAVVAATIGLLLGALAGAAVADGTSAAGAADVSAVSPPDSAATAAADAAPALWTPPPDEDTGDLALAPLIFKVCLGLGLVVMLAWGTVYLLRRTTLGQGMAGAGSAMRIVDRNWLGPKKAIYLVDIAGRTLALGVTEEQISVLSSWEPGEIDLASPAPPPGRFAHQFKSILQGRRGDAEAAGKASR